jgi:hypothetical protein
MTPRSAEGSTDVLGSKSALHPDKDVSEYPEYHLIHAMRYIPRQF